MMAQVKRSAMVVLSVLAGSMAVAQMADAVTVTVTGGTSLTGSGGASRLGSITCAGSGFTANVRATTTGTLPVTMSTNVLPICSGATIPPGIPLTTQCGASRLDATAVTSSGATPMAIVAINCDIRYGTGTTSTCHVQALGSAGATYANAAHTLTVDQDHSTIQLTGASAGCMLANSASTRWTNNVGGNLVFTVSPAVSISVV